jgi:aminoglycoside phosphotransferase (APT) family kinase protein
VPEWSAEVAVDAGLVRRLIGGQFPTLELGSVRLLGEGWDNAVWLVDERWIFRFPRREITVPAVERQVELLPLLAPLLPAPIPQPAFAGRAAEGYPWPFFGCPFIEGREAADAGLADEARVALARPLGEFLRALHAPDVLRDVPGADALPVDPMRRADMRYRLPRLRRRLGEVEALGLWRCPPQVELLLEAALALPPPTGTAVAHGDLHFRHVLVGGDGGLTGVIDWDDVCRADPAIDLQLMWSFLPPEGRGEFLSAYGRADEAALLRARVLALFLCAALATYGHHEDLKNVEREAIAGLARAVAD